MTRVALRGRLICADAAEAEIVVQHLPRHIELSRAEPGCVSFEVDRTDDPLVWRVAELFSDHDTFDAHQARGRSSEWGRATAAITRDYVVTTVDAP